MIAKLAVFFVASGWIVLIGGMVRKNFRVQDGLILLVALTAAGALIILFPRNAQALQGALVLMAVVWYVFGRHIKRKIEQRQLH